MLFAFVRRAGLPTLLATAFGCAALCQAQNTVCAPYLRFQVEAPTDQPLTRDSVRGTVGGQRLDVTSLEPFRLTSRSTSTLSMLIVVWNGGLDLKAAAKFAASLHKEERLHLRLAVLTRNGLGSQWTDDPAEQDEALRSAALNASKESVDEPGFTPKTSDERVLEVRWEGELLTATEDLLAQPGKHVILELLPKPQFRPPLGMEHWRIPPDRNYIGEMQVHNFAALGTVPVYRTHNDSPALTVPIPFGDASYSPPLGPSGDIPMIMDEEQELADVRDLWMPPVLPPPSSLFHDLGGRDVFEAADAMPMMLADLVRAYTVVIRMPNPCTRNAIFAIRLDPWTVFHGIPSYLLTPQWVLPRLLGTETPRPE